MRQKSGITKYLSVPVLIACFLLGACSDEPKPYKKVGPFTTQAERTDAFYELYVYEKKICPGFVKAIEGDQDLLAKLENPDIRRTTGINALLSGSREADDESVRYVLNNSLYFIVDIDYYGSAGYYYVPKTAVFCSQGDQRLKELEAIGASDKAWEVREYFLNQMLTDVLAVGMPGYDGPAGFDFSELKKQFNAAKRTYYAPAYKQRLRNWADNAAIQMRERLKTIKDSESELTKAQQAAEVEKRITALKKGLE